MSEVRIRGVRALAMVVLVTVPVLVFGLWGEKVPYGNGLGFDGQVYGRMAMRLRETVLVEPISSYRVKRLLPSAIVHGGLRATGAELHAGAVIRGFVILNAVLLAASVLLWLRIARSLGLGAHGQWLGFIGLFVNWAVLKQSTYYPVLTDVAALTLGLAALAAYLERRRLPLLAIAVAGAFTWPVAVHGTGLMLASPRPQVPGTARLPRWMALLVASATAAAFFAAVVYLYVYRGRVKVVLGTESATVIGDLAPVSILAAVAFVFVVTLGLASAIRVGTLGAAIRTVSPLGVVLATVPFVVIMLAVRALADFDEGAIRSLLAIIAIGSIAKPFSFFVPPVVYFGPIIIIIARYWRPFCDVAGSLGPAIPAVILMTILIGMTSESRFYMFGFPIIVAVGCQAASADTWPRRRLILIAALALLYSKVWLTINTRPMEGALLEFPWQWYFMQHGPWMSNITYAIHAGCVALTVVFLVAILRPSPPVLEHAKRSEELLSIPPRATRSG